MGSNSLFGALKSFTDLSPGFTTSCSGDCGSSGWRIMGGAIDSGYHADHGVDSWLRLQVSVIRG